MESALLAYLLENGPMSALSGGLFYLWRKEAESRRAAEQQHVDNLQSQITLWRELKEQADAND